MNVSIANNQGWSCPHCNKAHAPDVKTCPEPVIADCWPPVVLPTPNTCDPWPPTTWVSGTPECGTASLTIPHDPTIQSWNTQ